MILNLSNLGRTLLILCLALLSVSIGVTITPSNQLSLIHNFYDLRIHGFAESGWTLPDFTFKEPRVSGLGAKVKVHITPPFNDKTVYSKMRYYYGDAAAVESTAQNLVELRQQYLGLQGIKVKGRALKPQRSKKTNNLLGTKVSAIEIEPRAFLLLPSPSFGFWPLLLVFSALLLTSYVFKAKSSGLLPLLPCIFLSPAIGWLLGQNRLAYWHRGYWLWIFYCAIVAGIIIYKYFAPREDAPQKDSGTSLAQTAILICGIFLVALFLRFQGLDFGLPGLFHPDESRKIKIAQGMVLTGDLNPHYFRHPTFLLYATAFNSWIYSLFTGAVPDLPTVAYLGRSVSAFLGSLSVIFVFLIGRLLFGTTSGLIAASFLAVSPLHVVCSRYIKEDASLLFFTTVCFYFTVLALKNKCRIRYTALAALFAGFSAASKYSGLLNLIFPAVIVYERTIAALQNFIPSAESRLSALRFSKDSPGFTLTQFVYTNLLVFFLFAAGFLFFCPYAVLDHELFLYDFLGEKQHMERGHGVPISAISYFWAFHIQRSILSSFQAVFAILAFLGMGYLIAKRSMYSVLIIGAILLFYLPAEWVKAKPEPQPERYVLPCIPFLALAAAFLIASLNRLKSYGLRYIGIVALSVALIQSAQYSFKHGQSIQLDTRLQAKQWVYDNIPVGSKIIIDWHFYGPPGISSDYEVLQFKDKAGAKLARTVSAENFRKTGYDYLILSSFSYGRFLNPAYRSHNASKRYKQFFKEMEAEAVFQNRTYAYGFHNPDIRIFKLR